MKKNNLLLFLWVLLSWPVGAQYYNNAFGLNGAPLKTALHDIIKNHTVITYADLWTAFQQTDTKPDGTVWDIYTDVPGGNPVIVFQFVTDQCGNYSAEGDCYNREHTWPKEKFGGDNAYPMYADLHHIYPTDGWVNNKRAAYPYGMVSNVSYTSLSNASKLGTGNTYAAYNDKIFEPIDSFKGDLARTYFYMSTRYENEDAGWDNWTMANGAQLTADAITLLLNWHHQDPVSQKELDRNNAVATIQHNRNPFIDYPAFADCIWGSADCSASTLRESEMLCKLNLFPNPATHFISLRLQAATIQSWTVYNVYGQQQGHHVSATPYPNEVTVDIENYRAGNYMICLQTSAGFVKKIFSKAD